MLFKNKKKETLYVVAHITNGKSKTTYFHAKNYNDAKCKLVTYRNIKTFGRNTMILAMGPAIGCFQLQKQ